jgi:hypothetical protein
VAFAFDLARRKGRRALAHARRASSRPGKGRFEISEDYRLRVGGFEKLRCRRVRIIRDYGMSDRRQAQQFYPEVPAAGERISARCLKAAS